MLIVNFGQVVDLERGGAFTHQFTVELPDGQRVGVVTDEATIQQLADLITSTTPTAQRRGGNNRSAAESSVSEDVFRREMARIAGEIAEDDEGDPDFEPDEGEIFGGDYDPGNLAAQASSSISSEPEPVMGVMVQQAAPTPRAQSGLGQGPRIRVDSDGFALPPTARTVPADEKGYPIVSGAPKESNIPDDDGEDDGTQM